MGQNIIHQEQLLHKIKIPLAQSKEFGGTIYVHGLTPLRENFYLWKPNDPRAGAILVFGHDLHRLILLFFLFFF
jgi:hypothetical protein